MRGSDPPLDTPWKTGYNTISKRSITTMKDDEKYQRLMSAYKVARRNPNKIKEASKLLNEAWRLEKEGEVSKDVIEGMRYV